MIWGNLAKLEFKQMSLRLNLFLDQQINPNGLPLDLLMKLKDTSVEEVMIIHSKLLLLIYLTIASS